MLDVASVGPSGRLAKLGSSLSSAITQHDTFRDARLEAAQDASMVKELQAGSACARGVAGAGMLGASRARCGPVVAALGGSGPKAGALNLGRR